MEKNKTKIVTIASLLALVILIVGATYAYFQAQTGQGSQTDIRINANTVDTLTFETGDPITLTLDQENFAQGKGNQTGSTFAKAMLTANNKTNSATEHYYMYLNITENTFTYTQDEDTPEILLTIKDTNNNEITSINGLTYKTVTDGSVTTLKGFDITNHSGLITIFDNREITTTSSITEEWNVTVTYVNYNVDQSANAGKSFSASMMIQNKNLPSILSDVCKDGDNLANCIKTLSSKSASDITKIYYHNFNLMNGASDNSYRYAGSNGICTFNEIEVQATNSYFAKIAITEEKCKNIYSLTSDSYEVYYDSSITNLFTDKKSVIWENNSCKTIDGENIDLGFSQGFKAITEDTCKSNSYLMKIGSQTARVANLDINYIGNGTWEGLNNFVCFGSKETPCPTDNLYRIIGVIEDKVKLIKYDYATSALLGTDGSYDGYSTPNEYYNGKLTEIDSYFWNNTTGENIWSKSNLNQINLNTNFINNLGTEWSNKIATTTWKVGGNTKIKIEKEIPSMAYQNEITNPSGETEYSAKIGLMYVSDYGFAAIPKDWTKTLDHYNNARENNWMYMGLDEWSITRASDSSGFVFTINEEGMVGHKGDGVVNARHVRPVFNLEPSVSYVSGSGSQSNPIRIN